MREQHSHGFAVTLAMGLSERLLLLELPYSLVFLRGACGAR